MSRKKDLNYVMKEIEPYLNNKYVFVEYKGANNLYIKDNYGLLKVAVADLKRGYSFSINSAVNKNDYAKSKIIEKFPEINVSKVDNVINGSSKVIVSDKYGDLEYRYNDLVLNKKTKMSIKSAVNKTDYFKNILIEKFGNLYDYSKIEYNVSRNKVEVICRLHGSFLIKANHLLHGTGCSKCGFIKTANFQKESPSGWSKNSWKLKAEQSKHFESFKLYVIEVYNNEERFIKIGRTFNKINKRFNNYTLPYKYKVAYIYSDECDIIYDLENKLKMYLKAYKYIPLIEFKGMHECFQIPETYKAKYEWDGHSSSDVVNRLLAYIEDEKD